MSIQEFLSHILGVPVTVERPDTVVAQVSREKFPEAIDELVNVRGLANQTDGTSVRSEGLVGVGLSLVHIYATDDRQTAGTFGVHAVLHDDSSHTWLLLSTTLPGEDPTYPSVTRRVMAAHWYERGLFDQFGITAVGHPHLLPLVQDADETKEHFPLRKDFQWNAKLEQVERSLPASLVTGEGVCEVSVGPVHGLITEPYVLTLTIAGEQIIEVNNHVVYGHRGLEKILEGKLGAEALPFIERFVGDAPIAQTLAFVQAYEAIGQCQVPERARLLRTLFNELERVTTHIQVLASLGGQAAGYQVLASLGGRLKERMARLSEELCGNRFWRGQIIPGGVSREFTVIELQKLSIVVGEVIDEMLEGAALALASDSFRDRVELIGILSAEAALAYGAVGIPARASGLDRDVRRDHPYAAYDVYVPTVPVKSTGDVYARFWLRLEELKQSKTTIQAICQLPIGDHIVTVCNPESGWAIGAVESGRGEVVYAVHVRQQRIWRLSVRDPSVCNLPLLQELAPGNIVSDMALCQASLDISYAGIEV